MVADVIKSFDTIDRSFLDCALDALVCPLGLGRSISLVMIGSGSGSSWRRVQASLGAAMEVLLRAARCIWFLLLYVPWCGRLEATPRY